MTAFITHIKNTYGNSTKLLVKQLLTLNKKTAVALNHKLFLIKCRQSKVIPKHILQNQGCVENLLITNHPYKYQVNNMMKQFQYKILSMEIKINCHRVEQLQNEYNNTYNSIKHKISLSHWNKLITIINRQFKFWNNKTRSTHITKLNNLCHEQLANSFTNDTSEWFLNLTDQPFPDDVEQLLALGPKHNVELKMDEIPIFHVIADIEHIIMEVTDPSMQNELRASTANIMTNFAHREKNKNQNIEEIQIYNKTKHFLKEHPDILVIKADKTNKTVIINRSEYIQKMNNLLSDNNTYELTSTDRTIKIQNKNNTIIKNLYTKNYIDQKTKYQLTSDNATPPQMYGLIKLHKENKPMRPIVAATNSPTANLAKFLADMLKGLESDTYFVKDSFAFVDFIENIQLQPGFKLVSLDVVSLFTNVPLDLTLQAIDNQWPKLQNRTKIPKSEFLELIKFCYTQGFFQFNGKYYLQKKGFSMGSSLAPIASCLVMDLLLDTVIPKLPFNIPFLIKYVDDIITAVPENLINTVLNEFNTFNNNLQFTLEVEDNGEISYLDTTLCHQSDGTITHKWYRKPTATTRYINYNSKHPKSQILNVAHNLKTRAVKLTSKQYQHECFEKLTTILRDNNFPSRVINKILYNSNTVNSTAKQNKEQKQFYSIPNTGILAGNLKKCLEQKLNINIALKPVKRVGNLFSKLKDNTETGYRSNVVYKINCQMCNGYYIGQTKRYLKTRLSEHKRNSSKPTTTGKCALDQHRFDTGHVFNFEDARVIDNESNLKKRLFLEMLHIACNNESVNFRTDIQGLNNIYLGICKLFG